MELGHSITELRYPIFQKSNQVKDCKRLFWLNFEYFEIVLAGSQVVPVENHSFPNP